MAEEKTKGPFSGQILAERYRLGHVLGAQCCGRIYLGWDQDSQREVAVKLLEPSMLGGARKLADKTLRKSIGWEHPNLVRVLNFEVNRSIPIGISPRRHGGQRRSFVVTERMRGLSLAQKVAENGPLPLDEGLFITVQVLEALTYIHREGLVHGGIGPGNIFLQHEHAMHADYVRVCDTGYSARFLTIAVPLTNTTGTAGLDPYCSPEQAGGDAPDARSDVFSACAVLFFVLTGKQPFKVSEETSCAHALEQRLLLPWLSDSLHVVSHDLDAQMALIRVAGKGMSLAPSERFADAGVMRDMLLAELGCYIPSALPAMGMCYNPEPVPKACSQEVSVLPYSGPVAPPLRVPDPGHIHAPDGAQQYHDQRRHKSRPLTQVDEDSPTSVERVRRALASVLKDSAVSPAAEERITLSAPAPAPPPESLPADSSSTSSDAATPAVAMIREAAGGSFSSLVPSDELSNGGFVLVGTDAGAAAAEPADSYSVIIPLDELFHNALETDEDADFHSVVMTQEELFGNEFDLGPSVMGQVLFDEDQPTRPGTVATPQQASGQTVILTEEELIAEEDWLWTDGRLGAIGAPSIQEEGAHFAHTMSDQNSSPCPDAPPSTGQQEAGASAQRPRRLRRYTPADELLVAAGKAWHGWERGLASPRQTLDTLANGPERKLLALIEELAAIPDRDTRLAYELKGGDCDRVFISALAQCHGRRHGLIRAIIERVPEMDIAPLTALVRAMQLILIQGHESQLLAFHACRSVAVRAAALEILGFHQVDLGKELEAFFHDENPTILDAGLRAARAPSGHFFIPLIEWCLDSPHLEVRDSALVTGLVHGSMYAWKRCHEVVERREKDPQTALLLLVILGGTQQQRMLLNLGQRDSRLMPDILFALGFSGNPSVAEVCLTLMSDPAQERLATEAFCAITGLDLVANGLEAAPGTVPMTGAWSPEASLSRPDISGVHRWWVENCHRFDSNIEYLDGQPLSQASLLSCLRKGTNRRRHGLALELAIRTRGAMQLQTRTWCWQQREHLRIMLDP